MTHGLEWSYKQKQCMVEWAKWGGVTCCANPEALTYSGIPKWPIPYSGKFGKFILALDPTEGFGGQKIGSQGAVSI